SNSAISSELTLFNQSGSQVELGEVDVVPVDQTLLYIEPVYVESQKAQIPTLDDVVVVYGGKAYHSNNASLDNALCQIVNPDGSKPFVSYCNTPFALETPNLTTSNGGGGSNGSPTTTTTTTTVPGPPSSIPPGATVASLLAQARQDLVNAQTALAQQNLGQYQADVKAATTALDQAAALESPSGSPTTTAPKPSGGSTTTAATTTTTKPTG
ncbi:MAG TPA: hypothetical protein VKI19_13785, partial [Acidimicrobiales bacterium]|nr:hypothetical protein [Acidimicrobiales bacterium]